MASPACLRLPFLPARSRSSSSLPRVPRASSVSVKCCAADADASSVSIPSASHGGVGAICADGLVGPPAPVPDSPAPAPAPASRYLHWLPRPLTSVGLMEAGVDGLRVAYQGCPGAYSEVAAKKAYPNCQTVPCEHFDTTFKAVENWLVDRAVLPLENSLGGSIHRNFDLLLQHRLHIVGEVCLAVRHCLLANPGVKIENVRSAMSHPQALAQCEYTLTEFGIEHREAVDDTAGAAKIVAEQMLQDTGAIASSLAAELYGLNVLTENIQLENQFKTSIVFSLEEGPRQLFKALGVFALREINLTKIESRPHKKRPFRIADANSPPLKHFDYLFYMDLEASMADPKTQNALGNLKVRVLD
ncbi:hypothetical protein ABZP36_005338 [Zizania latifolia]